MDRSDERRDDREHDDSSSSPDHDPGTLGIGGATPPRDHVPSDRKDHDRALADDERAGSREVQRTPGATGIDMGAGGTGTDLERD